MKVSLLLFFVFALQTQVHSLIAHRNILWRNGQIIKVKFLVEEDKGYRAFIASIAKSWEKHANITFEFVSHEETKADINIYSNNEANPSSQLGINAKYVKQSMNLPLYDEYKKMKKEDESDYYFLVLRSVVLHEFGHALGLNHEHQNPNAGICWNEPMVYKMCADSKPQMQECKSNWLEPKTGSDLISSAYDRYSIMHYRIKNKLTSCDYDAPWNTDLSMMDKRWVHFLYPFPDGIDNSVVRKFKVNSTEIKLTEFEDEWGNDALEIYGSIGIINTQDLEQECYHDLSFPGCFESSMERIQLLIDISKNQEAYISMDKSSGRFLSKASFDHAANDKYFLIVHLYDKDYLNRDDHFVYSAGGYKHFEYLIIPLDLFHRQKFGILSYKISDSRIYGDMAITLEIDLEEVSLSAR